MVAVWGRDRDDTLGDNISGDSSSHLGVGSHCRDCNCASNSDGNGGVEGSSNRWYFPPIPGARTFRSDR